MNNSKIKVLVTGGHLTPAVAVLNELRKRGFYNFVWVGHKFNQSNNRELSPEYSTIKSMDIRFIQLKTGKLVRQVGVSNFFYFFKNLILIPWGFLKSIYIIVKENPKIVVSFGGYLALPIVIVSRFLGKKVVTHEQTIVAGVANKIIAKFANKVLVSFESSIKFFPENKTVFTGNPIRRDIFLKKSDVLTKDFNKNLPVLYITGGNQGANEINRRVFQIIERLLEDFNVIHQTGNSTATNDYSGAQKIKERLKPEHKIRYTVKDYISESEIGEALNSADVILSRAGANTVCEILALAKFAVLIPIPFTSHNEQEKNAELVESIGLGFVLKQSEKLTPETLYQSILLTYNQKKSGKGFNNKPIEECEKNAKSKVILDAPQKVADEVVRLLEK